MPSLYCQTHARAKQLSISLKVHATCEALSEQPRRPARRVGKVQVDLLDEDALKLARRQQRTPAWAQLKRIQNHARHGAPGSASALKSCRIAGVTRGVSSMGEKEEDRSLLRKIRVLPLMEGAPILQVRRAERLRE